MQSTKGKEAHFVSCYQVSVFLFVSWWWASQMVKTTGWNQLCTSWWMGSQEEEEKGRLPVSPSAAHPQRPNFPWSSQAAHPGSHMCASVACLHPNSNTDSGVKRYLSVTDEAEEGKCLLENIKIFKIFGLKVTVWLVYQLLSHHHAKMW